MSIPYSSAYGDQGWLPGGNYPPPLAPPPAEEGSLFHGSRSCPSADGRPETIKYPGARASCPQSACNCGANGGQDARAPGYLQSSEE
jgi:hypothetical protein